MCGRDRIERYATSAHELLALGVGYDGSPESEQALDAARELASRARARIKAMSVLSLQSIPYGEPVGQDVPPAAKQLMDASFASRMACKVSKATSATASGRAGALSEGLDLLLVGSRGYGPVGRLLNGSTSNYLSRHARCPLLVLPRSNARRRPARAGEEEQTPVGTAA